MIFNPKSIHPWWYHYLFYWIQLAQGLIGVLTFGFVYLNWTLPYARWAAGYQIRKMKEARNGLVKNKI